MISDATKADLRAELSRLTRMRESIDRKMQCLEEILAPVDGVALPPRAGPFEARAKSPSSPPPANGTFRARVLAALTDRGETPTTADQIASAIIKSGFRHNGKTPLKTLISSELWRMANKASLSTGVRQIGHGLYTRLANAGGGPKPAAAET